MSRSQWRNQELGGGELDKYPSRAFPHFSLPSPASAPSHLPLSLTLPFLPCLPSLSHISLPRYVIPFPSLPPTYSQPFPSPTLLPLPIITAKGSGERYIFLQFTA